MKGEEKKEKSGSGKERKNKGGYEGREDGKRKANEPENCRKSVLVSTYCKVCGKKYLSGQ